MAKNTIILVIVMIFVFNSVNYAAIVGNPNLDFNPKDTRFAFEIDHTNSRDLIGSSRGVTGNLELDAFSSFLFEISWPVLFGNNSRFDVRFGIIGPATVVDESGYSVDCGTGPAAGIGFSNTLNDFGDGLKLGFDAKFLFGKCGTGGSNKSSSDRELEYREFEAALILSKKINNFIPYAGVKLSRLDMTIPAKTTTYYYYSLSSNAVDMENDNNIGLVFGFDLLTSENSSINLEFRFIDETAISLGFRF